jgi:hypothetical protein
MIRDFCTCICLALVAAAIPLRAANRPHAGADNQQTKVWTNDDLERLHDRGLISIVGQLDQDRATSPSMPAQYLRVQDPEWYAEQAAKLRDELEYRQAQLGEYQQALADTRSLRESTGGINLVGEDFAVTPEAGIEILQQRVKEEQARLDDLEDLARRNDIEPGALRGPSHDRSEGPQL